MVGTGMERHSILGLKLQKGFLWRSGYRKHQGRAVPTPPQTQPRDSPAMPPGGHCLAGSS